MPLHTVFKKILTPEQIAAMSAEEINALLRRELFYDDYRYQKENGIRITEPYRAEGLHKVLHQCPHCMTESKMDSKGTALFLHSVRQALEPERGRHPGSPGRGDGVFPHPRQSARPTVSTWSTRSALLASGIVRISPRRTIPSASSLPKRM